MKIFKRVAIYARYSTDRQNPTSIDDQVSLCCSKLEELPDFSGTPLIFSDAAVSGSSMDRPGLQALLQAARVRTYKDVVKMLDT